MYQLYRIQQCQTVQLCSSSSIHTCITHRLLFLQIQYSLFSLFLSDSTQAKSQHGKKKKKETDMLIFGGLISILASLMVPHHCTLSQHHSIFFQVDLWIVSFLPSLRRPCLLWSNRGSMFTRSCFLAPFLLLVINDWKKIFERERKKIEDEKITFIWAVGLNQTIFSQQKNIL